MEVAEVSMINLMYSESSDDVLKALSKQGILVSESVEMDVPALPNDITDLDDEDLIRLFQHLNEFSKFIKVQASCAQIDETEAKKQMEYLEATLMIEHSAPKVTVSSIKAKIETDPEMQKAIDKHNAKQYYRKMIDVMVSNLEADMHLVSRELTRRTSGGNFKTRGSKFTI